MENIKLVIVDDNFVARRGLRSVLEMNDDIVIIGEASNGNELLQLKALDNTDVILMDIRMAGMDGIQASSEVLKRFPSIKILAMTSVEDPIILANIINAGARGYLVYGYFQPSEMLDAIRKTSTGDRVYLPALEHFFGSEIVSTVKEIDMYYHDPLTERERDVLELIASGCDNNTIAKIMDINEKTVKNYVTRIYSKLGVTQRREAILYVLNHILSNDAI